MELLLLTRFYKYASDQIMVRLMQEAKFEGFKMSVVRPLDIRLRVRPLDDKVLLSYMNSPWKNVDLVVPILRHDDAFGWDVVEQLKAHHQRVVNILRVPHGDRAQMHKIFNELKIPMPPSFIGDRAYVWRNRSTLPWPLLVRARLSHGGRLQRVIADWNQLDECLHEHERVYEDPMFLMAATPLQGDYISTLTVGNDVVAAVQQIGGLPQTQKVGKLAINQLQSATLGVAEIELLRKIRKLYGAAYVGIDLMRGPQGLVVADINTAPNVRMFEDIAGKNFVKMIAKVYKNMALNAQTRQTPSKQ